MRKRKTNSAANQHDEHTLPKWAQTKLAEARTLAARAQADLARLQQAHVLLSSHEWFTVPNRRQDGIMKLWMLYPDHPFPVCSLSPGDILLVGRASRSTR